MAKILCKTKVYESSQNKPRVYFTCHPEDFERCFNKICNDILLTHNCAIFYTEDMTEVIEEQDIPTDLESNNLFVVPITYHLLSQPNRAMDSDIPFALEKHIPILPLMMESGIDELYLEKFGNLQYLSPHNADITEIPYTEKLKRYLESVLISSETIDDIRAAFDNYIFLSYRKKDRRYANKLMRLIHSFSGCQDVAIWYDEFLTPGENFRENIETTLKKSKLFALVVTPNLLEEPDGMPNFVMAEEYPTAQKLGIDILPIEMESTDKVSLCQKFRSIPTCISLSDEAFGEKILESLSRVTTRSNDDDPVHKYLIGLAYLQGVDVEVDREKGVALISAAAESGLAIAIGQMYRMHNDGDGLPQNHQEALKWAKKMLHIVQEKHGVNDVRTLKFFHFVADHYLEVNKAQEALELYEKEYSLRCALQGEDNTDTLSALMSLAFTHNKLGNYRRALELYDKEYNIRCTLHGETHLDTIRVLTSLAYTYSRLGDYQKALELYEKEHNLRLDSQGEDHLDTIVALFNLASTHSELGNHHMVLMLYQKINTLCCKIFLEKHPNATSTLITLSEYYEKKGDYSEALKIREKAYTLVREIYGENHPDTILTQLLLALLYHHSGNNLKAWVLCEEAYEYASKEFEEGNPILSNLLISLAMVYRDLKEFQKALMLLEKAYSRLRLLHGEIHAKTIVVLSAIGSVYLASKDYSKALETYEKVYKQCCIIWGENHPETIERLKDVELVCYLLGDYAKGLKLKKQIYAFQCASLGKTHQNTLASNKDIIQYYKLLRVCQHCGGPLKGLFHKKCGRCGKAKDY